MKRLSRIVILLLMSIAINHTALVAQDDLTAIKAVAEKFSRDFVSGDYGGMHNAYWDDAFILPPGREILQGKEAIIKYWTFGSGFKQIHHKMVSEKIEIAGNTAYDIGYWYAQSMRGESLNQLGSGKYLIVWQRRNGVWKMFQDIWNNRSDNWEPED